MMKFLSITLFIFPFFLLFAQGKEVGNNLSQWELVPQIGHLTEINKVSFSPDGKYFLSSTEAGVKLWRSGKGELIRNFEHSKTLGITASALSLDGSQVLTSGQKTIKLWDSKSGRLVRVFSDKSVKGLFIEALAFSPKGRYILSAGERNVLKLWNRETGKLVRTFKGHTQTIQSLAFSPDGQFMVSGASDGYKSKKAALHIWEVKTGLLLQKIEGHKDQISSVVFSPDGRTVLSGSWDNTAKLWNVISGKFLRSFGDVGKEHITTVTFSADGKQLAIGATDKKIKIYDVASGKLIRSLDHQDYVYSVAFSPDKKHILSGSHTGILKFWNRATGKLVWSQKGNNTFISTVALCPDGSCLITSSFDTVLRVWNPQTGKLIRSLKKKGWVSGIRAVAVSADGQKIVAGTGSGGWRLWNRKTGGLLAHTRQYWTVGTTLIAFSQDGRQLLAAGNSGGGYVVRLWDIKSLYQLRTYTKKFPPRPPFSFVNSQDVGMITSIAFSPNGRIIILGKSNGEIEALDKVSSSEIFSVKGAKTAVIGLAFTKDGKQIISLNRSQETKIWDSSTGKEIAGNAEMPAGSYGRLTIHPGNEFLTTYNKDKIFIQSKIGQKRMMTMRNLPNKSWYSYTSDGSYVASADAHSYLRLVEKNGYGIRPVDESWRKKFLRPDGLKVLAGQK